MSDVETSIAPAELADDFIVSTNYDDPAPEPAAEAVAPVVPAKAAPKAAAPVAEAEPTDEELGLVERNADGTFKKKGARSRIQELLGKHRVSEAQRIAAEQERDQLRAAQRPVVEQPKPAPVVDDAMPADLASYELYEKKNPGTDYDAWVDAKTEWRVEQRLKARDTAQQSERAQVDANARVQQVLAKGTESHADFPAVLQAAEAAGVVWSPIIRDFVLGHPLGHDVAYWLAKNPDESRRLSAITHPVIAGVELAGVLTRLAAAGSAPAPKAPPISKANPVIEPLTGTPSAGDPDVLSDDLPIEDFIKIGNRLEGRGRR